MGATCVSYGMICVLILYFKRDVQLFIISIPMWMYTKIFQKKSWHRCTLLRSSCEESVLRKRVSEKWGSLADNEVMGSGMSWVEMAVLRNRYFKTYHDEHPFRNMIIIDTTDMTIEEAANQVEAYIKQQIDLFKQQMRRKEK